jgi:hypothetical protein
MARSLATGSALPGTRFPTLGFFSLLARWEKMGFSFYMARYGITGFVDIVAR